MANHETPTPSRRAVLKAGSVGVFAAAFLAACSDDRPVGVSGTPSPTTEVPPTVPERAPTTAELEEVQVQLNTLASIEALVAQAYTDHGDRITDPRTAPLVARFAADHRAAADALSQLTDERTTPEPNAWLLEHLVGPAEATLVSETNVRVFLRNLESTLTATYVNAVPTMTELPLRQTLMTHGGAAARRVTALSDGVVPAGAVFPPTDLISNNAFLRTTEEEAAEESAEDAPAE